ncbi:Histidine kinase-like ATPase domain-containing protein [Streptacidiphilus jiangxiensis]|uniref:Histidine kinase-like ATPase domain-containing protein n=1 Tax=Streptacidiphilus jiangxiensis TaxID=235985 RepID=A0A1H7MS52_STRJI|nr:Histidine kinase-like ATPase domain-containing protein [Streptacidiphilus jiangxiensis]
MRWELPAERTSVREARRAVAHHLDSWSVPASVRDDAVLLVSELVTNVVLHTDSSRLLCEVALSADGPLVIEVHDDHRARLGAPGAPAASAENGRGLLIVRELAETWGVGPSHLTGGNVVRATLPLPPRPGPPLGTAPLSAPPLSAPPLSAPPPERRHQPARVGRAGR